MRVGRARKDSIDVNWSVLQTIFVQLLIHAAHTVHHLMLEDRVSYKGDNGPARLHAEPASAHVLGSKYDRLIASAKSVPAAKTIVVHPCDESSLRGAVEARRSRHHRADSCRPGR